METALTLEPSRVKLPWQPSGTSFFIVHERAADSHVNDDIEGLLGWKDFKYLMI